MVMLLTILSGMILSQESGPEKIIDVKDPDKNFVNSDFKSII
jgi:hypothetical protein